MTYFPTQPLGHQGGIKTGGNEIYERVLWCNNLDLTFNYGKLFVTFKEFGAIERIKVRITGKSCLSAFITFFNNSSAKEAKKAMENSPEMNSYSFSILSSRNVADEDSDYIPKLFSESIPAATSEREKPIPLWYVANFKQNGFNSIKGLQSLERATGIIPKANFKKYGKSLLIKAKDDVQALMLLNIRPSQDDTISKVYPHSSFNYVKGIIYSGELCDFSDDEILNLCPECVLEVKKLNGRNNAILLTFSSTYLPDYIDIRHLSFRVRKYRFRPKQCFDCFEYGHFASKCENKKKCYKCSQEINNDSHNCPNIYYCFHCEEDHSPQSQLCPRFQFERDIVELAHNEYISYGRARAKLMGANKSPEASYAKVVSQIQLNKVKNPTRNHSELNSTNTAAITGIANSTAPIPSTSRTSETLISPVLSQKERSSPPAVTVAVSPPISYKDKTSSVKPGKPDQSCKPKSQSNKTKDKSNKNSAKKSTTKVDEDGFILPEGNKRARPLSPKGSYSNLESKNMYNLLDEESSPVKKKPVNPSDPENSKALNPNQTSSIRTLSPNVQMETEATLRSPRKSRAPSLDRKLLGAKSDAGNRLAQSKGKAGISNPKHK